MTPLADRTAPRISDFDVETILLTVSTDSLARRLALDLRDTRAELAGLRIERRNHVWSWTTGGTVEGGVRFGKRCTRCRQWAMGDRPGDSADEVCPDADWRYVSDWTPAALVEDDTDQADARFDQEMADRDDFERGLP